MLHADVFSVRMQNDSVIVSDDGQCVRRLRAYFKMHRAAIARTAAGFEALADVFVGDDWGLLLEEGVSADVIAMIVRVDDEPDRLAANPLKCRLTLLGEGSSLVIDENNPILAHRCCNISTD